MEFSAIRGPNRWKIKIFKICSIGFLIIIITNHKPKIRSIGSFLVSFIDFEWTHYCSKWANIRLFLYIKCLQVHELKVFKFWENGHFLYALDFFSPGTISRQKIEICLRYFAGSLEPSKTIYLLKISSFQAFLVILWDFYKFWKISDFWGFCPGREHFESSTTHILAKIKIFKKGSIGLWTII